MTKPYLPRTAGPCAKADVIATLVTPAGERYESSNFCLTPQKTCPRDAQGYSAGEGYHLCKQVCNQLGHAEENVIFFAKKQGADVRGAKIVVDYTRICDNCKKVCSDEGVAVMTKEDKEALDRLRKYCSSSRAKELMEMVIDAPEVLGDLSRKS